jgi:hypothetical protein
MKDCGGGWVWMLLTNAIAEDILNHDVSLTGDGSAEKFL